jgi:hypothetical protein
MRVGVTIAGLSAARIAQIAAAPQAQLRTARYKKAVYLAGGVVFKGPYRGHEPALINNLRFAYALKLLETALKLPEQERGSLPWAFLGQTGEDQYYLAAPNVGKREGAALEVMSSRLEQGVSVVRRGAAVCRVSDVEGTEQLTEGIMAASLQHLYLRFLFDIGDSGTHNVLVREGNNSTGRLIAGIDLEETRSPRRAPGSRLDHLFKKGPSKRQIELYLPCVSGIKPLCPGQLNSATRGRLAAVGISPQRLEEKIGLWHRLQ